jgi:uncharacterized protein YjiS (DUF1127 family)
VCARCIRRENTPGFDPLILTGSTILQSRIPTVLAIGVFTITTAKGNRTMEMHSRQSLYEIHGISVAARLRLRRRSIVSQGFARGLAFLKRTAAAIKAEWAVRRAIAEVSSMNDHMLRDIGINRSEIESVVRGMRTNAGTEALPIFWGDVGEWCPALPTVISPDILSEPTPVRELRKPEAPAVAPLAKVGSPLE